MFNLGFQNSCPRRVLLELGTKSNIKSARGAVSREKKKDRRVRDLLNIMMILVNSKNKARFEMSLIHADPVLSVNLKLSNVGQCL